MTLQTELDGDTGIVVTRRFAAPPTAVFDAHVEPDIVRRWLHGPDGWRMTTCETDARPGGRILFGWTGPDVAGFAIEGRYVALERPHRTEHVEWMQLPDGTSPENRVETLFAPDDDGTRMTMTMRLPSKEDRDAMLATGMTDGMEASYTRLDGLPQSVR